MANSNTNVKGMKYLQPGRTYSYDLDKDGKNEKIKYTKQSVNEDVEIVKVFINGKMSLNKRLNGSASLNLCNLNKKDKYIEFILNAIGPSDIIEYMGIYRYNKQKVSQLFQVKGDTLYGKMSLYRYKDFVLGTGNTFYINADTPIWIRDLGSYYCKMPFLIKGNKIVANKVSAYDIFSPSTTNYKKRMKFELKKLVTVYKTSSKVKGKAFTLKKGDKITIDKIKPVKKSPATAYVRINKGKKKGWIYIKEKGSAIDSSMFKEVPAWG